jgi:hypothetical protein
MGNIPLEKLMRVSSRGTLHSYIGKNFGRLGLQPNVVSSCGLLLTTDVGLLIG